MDTIEELRQVNFYSEDLLVDPYDYLRRVRQAAPVFRLKDKIAGRDQYIVTSRKLVEQVFLDNVTFSSNNIELMTGAAVRDAAVDAILSKGWEEVPMLLQVDEPEHTRLRSLAQKGFGPARVKRMTDIIDAAITKLINRFIERGECDFVREFAVPLPIHSTAEIMGFGADHYDDVDKWATAFFRRAGLMGSQEQKIADAHQIAAVKQYVEELIEERIRSPGHDLVTDLIEARIEGVPRFTKPELLATVMVLILGGAETTRSTFISFMARLLSNPDQLEILLNDLTLVPKAVDECLRMDTPGTSLWRVAAVDTELGGVNLKRGDVVQVRIDAANRDETMFADPDKFIIKRENNGRHLSFGAGVHFCIGFRLAREQLHRALPQLLTRMRNIKIVPEKSDLRAHPSAITRCLRELYLTFDPGAPGK